MLASVLSPRVEPERATSATFALGALAGCAVVAIVDPAESGLYPVCPTRALLGVDCPVCGTLRGLHAISRGQLVGAASHNALLLVAVPVALAVWLRWVAGALGRHLELPAVPRWVAPAAVTVAVVFAIVRNMSQPALAWLGSS